MICPSTDVNAWYTKHKQEFAPPICNKLLHKGQLTVMFVGGPNTRTDFHIDQSSEFFWMIRGNMELPIIEKGKKRVVKISQGQVFLLPPRIPHSPQRPETGSLGLVIERERDRSANEMDGLRWYTDFDKCEDVLWERYFYCNDLGQDLVPVVNAFKASDECKSGKSTGDNVYDIPPVKQDVESIVPDPFDLQPWIEKNRNKLMSGSVDNGVALDLFPKTHPDVQTQVLVCGQYFTLSLDEHINVETVVWTLEGETLASSRNEEPQSIKAGSCCVLGANWKIKVSESSLCLVIQQYDRKGNTTRL